MKKVVLFLLTSLCLVSCKDANENALMLVNDYDYVTNNNVTNFIDLNGKDVINRISERDDFILFYYSRTCSSCNETNETLQKYINDYHYIINRVDADVYTKDLLEKTYPDVFMEHPNPQLMFFKNGELTYSHGYINLKNYDAFKSRNKNRVKESNLYQLTTPEAIKEFINNNPNTTIFTYDKNNAYELNYYVQKIKKTHNPDNDEKTVIIEKNSLFCMSYLEIYKAIGLETTLDRSLIINMENGLVKGYGDYVFGER